MRRNVPIVITFVCGVFAILSFFFNDETAPKFIAGKLQEWGIILGAFAVVLGAGNIIRVSWHKAKRGEDRPFKILLLVALFTTMGLGLFFGVQKEIQPTFFNGGVAEGEFNPFYWVYFNIQLPLGATMFSLLVFFITSAAYRAFRMRSLEAGILLVTGVLVMLGQVPTGIPFLEELKNWIMDVPNVAAKRAILMGAAMGIAAMSIRIILGIERSYLGGD
ncbi:MAG: hypothetical protein ABFS86_15980 [Planctomycetota bacterium]